MLEDGCKLPFETIVLGVPVLVERFEVTEPNSLPLPKLREFLEATVQHNSMRHPDRHMGARTQSAGEHQQGEVTPALARAL